MESLLVEVKQKLMDEIYEKQNYIIKQNEKIVYMNDFLSQLEDNYYKLINNEITLDDFRTFLLRVDRTKIFFSVLEDVFKSLNRIGASKKSVDIFFESIYVLSNNIKFIVQKALKNVNEEMLTINSLSKLSHNISDSGDFIVPFDEKLISELVGYINSYNLNSFSLMREITLKNNAAYRKNNVKKNVKKIRGLKKFSSDVSLNTEFSESKGLNAEQQSIVDQAKSLIINSSDIKLSDDEKEYLDYLYSAKSREDIIDVLDCMNSDSSSLSMILFGIRFYVDSINDFNVDENIDILKVYIDLYNEYNRRVNDDLSNKFKFEQLMNDFNELTNFINEDRENIFSALNSEQLIFLDSFKDVSNDDDVVGINSTLKNLGLDFNFLLFYNVYIKIVGCIDNFIDDFDYISYSNRIKKIKEIFDIYEKYCKAKDVYIESNVFDEKMEVSDNANNLIFLTDSEGIPYVQKNIKKSNYEFGTIQFSVFNSLIDVLRNSSSTLIHTIAKGVKPDDPIYKKKRLDRHDVRLVFLQVGREFNHKPIYLIITGGVKYDPKNSEVYNHANSLKSVALSYKDIIEQMDEASLARLIESQEQIEENLIKSIAPKSVLKK